MSDRTTPNAGDTPDSVDASQTSTAATGKFGRRSLFAGIGAAAVTGAAGFALGRMGTAPSVAAPDPSASATTTDTGQPALAEAHRLPGATWPTVRVSPGDFVLGDEDGVVVVPEEHAEEVLAEAEAVVEREKELRAALRAGLSLQDAIARFGPI